MAGDTSSQNRMIEAVHPEWEGYLKLSPANQTVIHEGAGSTGRYHEDGGTLRVDWDRYAPETFLQVDGLYVEERLAPGFEAMSQARRRSFAQAVPPVQVISLLDSKDRRARFARLNAGCRYEFFNAVDGRRMELDNFFGGPLAERGIPYSPGAVGCALSHLALWQKADKENSAVTIVEDDAILHWDFATKSQAIMDHLPAGWDLIMWGWNFDTVMSMQTMPGVASMAVMSDQAALRRAIRKFQASPIDAHAYRLERAFGTCGYTISPGGARRFMARCFPLRNMQVKFPLLARPRPNDGIDIAMNFIYPTTQSYACFPALIVTPNFNAESLTLARI